MTPLYHDGFRRPCVAGVSANRGASYFLRLAMIRAAYERYGRFATLMEDAHRSGRGAATYAVKSNR